MRSEDTALGRLMSDFFCTEAKDMCYEELSDKVRYYKETQEGAGTMGSIIDELINEGKEKASIEHAILMIETGKLSLDEIALCSGLPIEKVRELAGEKTA